MPYLLANATTNGPGTTQSLSFPSTLYARGTFGGALVRIQMAPPSGELLEVEEIRFNAPGQKVIEPAGPYDIRAVVQDATDSTNITIEAIGYE